MRLEACDASPTFYRVRGFNKTVRDYLQYQVRDTLRYFEDNGWYLHRSQVVVVTQLGYAEFGHVDYSALDDELQMRIAGAKRDWKKGTPSGNAVPKLSAKVSREEALRKMYLQPDAPDSLIKAVWRALATEHHPDKGGDAEKFKEYLEAYNVVKG